MAFRTMCASFRRCGGRGVEVQGQTGSVGRILLEIFAEPRNRVGIVFVAALLVLLLAVVAAEYLL